MIRKAKAVWRGTGRAGSGNLTTDSGVLAETPYSFKTRFREREGHQPRRIDRCRPCRMLHDGPRLWAAGRRLHPHRTQYRGGGNSCPEGQGFRISRSALTLRAKVPNLDEATFARLAAVNQKNCPVSKVLNAEITLDAKLSSEIGHLSRSGRQHGASAGARSYRLIRSTRSAATRSSLPADRADDLCLRARGHEFRQVTDLVEIGASAVRAPCACKTL